MTLNMMKIYPINSQKKNTLLFQFHKTIVIKNKIIKRIKIMIIWINSLFGRRAKNKPIKKWIRVIQWSHVQAKVKSLYPE